MSATDIHAVRGEYDVVMFNHSLEHVPDPLADLLAARSLLAASGRVLVRLPTTSSEAYETYGTDWVQLDPPRHLAVPSRRGMAVLAGRAGLRLTRTIDDSSAFQFLWSELYRQDVAMLDPAAAQAVADLPPGRLEEYARRAAELNDQGRGDQALFVPEPERS